MDDLYEMYVRGGFKIVCSLIWTDIINVTDITNIYYEHSFLIFVLYFIMYLTFAILCVFYMCSAIGVIVNDDDDYVTG